MEFSANFQQISIDKKVINRIVLLLGPHNLLQRNNSLSPFLQRKYSLQAHQQRLNTDQNAPRWRPQYGRSISATASPNLDAHRRYQTAIPVLETDRPQIVRLKGNTSPIGKSLIFEMYFPSKFASF